MGTKKYILIALIFLVLGYMLHGYLALGSLQTQLNRLWPVLTFLVGIWGRDMMAFFKDRRDKRLVYDYLFKETEKYRDLHYGCVTEGAFGTRTDPKWRRTEDIASFCGLTFDRAKNICYMHTDIVLMTLSDIVIDRKNTIEYLEEKWAIKGFAP